MKCEKCGNQMTETYKGPEVGEEFPDKFPDLCGTEKWPQLGWLCMNCDHYIKLKEE